MYAAERATSCFRSSQRPRSRTPPWCRGLVQHAAAQRPELLSRTAGWQPGPTPQMCPASTAGDGPGPVFSRRASRALHASLALLRAVPDDGVATSSTGARAPGARAQRGQLARARSSSAWASSEGDFAALALERRAVRAWPIAAVGAKGKPLEFPFGAGEVLRASPRAGKMTPP